MPVQNLLFANLAANFTLPAALEPEYFERNSFDYDDRVMEMTP
jgi:hypothetical protein